MLSVLPIKEFLKLYEIVICFEKYIHTDHPKAT